MAGRELRIFLRIFWAEVRHTLELAEPRDTKRISGMNGGVLPCGELR